MGVRTGLICQGKGTSSWLFQFIFGLYKVWGIPRALCSMNCLLVCLYPRARNLLEQSAIFFCRHFTCFIMEQGWPQRSWHTSCVLLAQGACKQQQKALAAFSQAVRSVATVRFDLNKAMALP